MSWGAIQTIYQENGQSCVQTFLDRQCHDQQATYMYLLTPKIYTMVAKLMKW